MLTVTPYDTTILKYNRHSKNQSKTFTNTLQHTKHELQNHPTLLPIELQDCLVSDPRIARRSVDARVMSTMAQLARMRAMRKLSTAVSIPKTVDPAANGGIFGALKKALGPNAEPLPPNYKVDPALLREVPTRVTTLPNGFRVASETNPVGSAVVGVWIDAGTRYERADVNGAAHFLEHLIFKGTSNRTRREIEVGVEDVGAHLNAYTSREQTVYYARSLKSEVPMITELLADILQNSEVSDKAVAAERDVILREMEEVNQIPEEVVFDFLHQTAYQDCALARTILGPAEKIATLKRDDLKAYVNEHYKPHRMVLAAAGDIDHDELVSLASKHFGGIAAAPEAPTAPQLAAAEPAYLVGSDVRIRNDDMPVAHFAIAFESCGWSHPDAVAFVVLQALMGTYDRASNTGADSSFRMAQALSQVSNAKSANAFNTTYTDTGLFGIYATGEAPELDDIVHAILFELVRNCTKVDEQHLENAKLAVKTSMLAQLDGPTAVAEEIGRQLLVYGRRIPVAEWFARVDAVDVDAIRRIANKYIFDREMAVTAMGPIHSLPDYNWLRRRNYTNLT